MNRTQQDVVPARIGNGSEEVEESDVGSWLDVQAIQKIQDAFAEAVGVAAIITRPGGVPLTRPSRYHALFTDLILGTPKGLEHRALVDAALGRPRLGGPAIQRSLDGCFWDAGCSIFAGGQHVGNWLIGQVVDQDAGMETLLNYAAEIGVDQETFARALSGVPRMSETQFSGIARMLYLVVFQLFSLAWQNQQKALELAGSHRAEEAMMREKRMTVIVENELRLQRDHSELLAAQRTDELRHARLEIQRKNVELARREEDLERAIRCKSEILSNISHELRTPLNSILILSRLLADNKGGHLEGGQVTSAQTIYDAGNDLLGIINDMLDMAAFGSKGVPPKFEPVVLVDLVASMDHMFCKEARRKGLKFVTTIAADLPVSVSSDLGILHKALIKLIGNAIKFTQTGSVGLHLKRGPECDRPDMAVAIHIADTGIGIPAEQIASVFEPFHQAEASTTRRFGGVGLGLSLARRLIMRLGGDIRVTSAVGVGTTFTVFLPWDAGDASCEGEIGGWPETDSDAT